MRACIRARMCAWEIECVRACVRARMFACEIEYVRACMQVDAWAGVGVRKCAKICPMFRSIQTVFDPCTICRKRVRPRTHARKHERTIVCLRVPAQTQTRAAHARTSSPSHSTCSDSRRRARPAAARSPNEPSSSATSSRPAAVLSSPPVNSFSRYENPARRRR